MKNRRIKLIVSILLVLAASCNEPETVVTNIVHPDGSVTRRIEMRSTENNFEISDIQVPFDSTWTVRDSVEINEEGDTILWVKRGEKLFSDIEAVNLDYEADSGVNKELSRHAEYSKRFKWFNTVFYFSEIIDKNMQYGYPVETFLDQDELKWFYSPDKMRAEKKNGPDSLKYRAFADTVDIKIEKWYLRNLVSEWINDFYILLKEEADNDLTLESLKQKEDEFTMIVESNLDDFDSLWTNGYILREFIGDTNALKYKNEADTAAHLAIGHFEITFREYSVRTVMPGKLTGTNGFVDSSGIVLWPVSGDYFLTEPYIMHAESKIANIWAWFVSGLFLVFVVTGSIMWKKSKG